MNDEPFLGAEQLVGDDQRSNRVITRPSASIADHMGVALAETGIPGRIEPGVHAGEDGESSRRWQREFRLRAEGGRIAAVCTEDFVDDSHETLLVRWFSTHPRA